jgi:8-oxo-dGTP diphosphatase
MKDEKITKIGVGLMILKEGKMLLGQRRSSHGDGEFCGPGGHLEYMETAEATALREIAEECGSQFKVKNARVFCVSNLRDYAPKHYIDFGVIADWQSGEPEVTEPEFRTHWEWYNLDALPHPLFASVPNYLIAHRTGRFYFG